MNCSQNFKIIDIKSICKERCSLTPRSVDHKRDHFQGDIFISLTPRSLDHKRIYFQGDSFTSALKNELMKMITLVIQR